MSDSLFSKAWYGIVLHIPFVLFLLYGYSQLSLIWPDVATEKQIKILLLSGFGLACQGFFYWSRRLWQQATTERQTLAIASMLLLQVVFLYTAGMILDSIGSWRQSWIVSMEDILWLMLSFLLPGVCLLLMQLVLLVRVLLPSFKPIISLLLAIIIPATVYGISFVGGTTRILDIGPHLLLFIFIMTSLVFFFLLGYSLYGFLHKKTVSQGLKIFARVLIALVFPLLGLAFNANAFDAGAKTNLLGDYSHWSWFAVAVSNALLVLIPSVWMKNALYARIRLWLLGVGLIYVLYFLIVLMPLMPIAIVLIAAVGFGFLILSPMLLTILQVRIMGEQWRKWMSGLPLLRQMAFILSFVLVWPVLLTVDYWQDRQSLHQALAIMEQPLQHNTGASTVDTDALASALTVADKMKGRDFLGEKPLLSRYYVWLVLDNLTLSNSNIRQMRYLFLGEEPYIGSSWDGGNDASTIREISSKTQYDQASGAYRSWVHMEVAHKEQWAQEFSASFALPPGAFVSNYYLDMAEHREYGILAEEKAATWVYTQIVSRRRDPGLMRYQKDGMMSLRVFPVPADSSRTTGFEIMHKEPFTLRIKDRTLTLGDAPVKQEQAASDAPLLQAKVHFLINYSANQSITALQTALEEAKSSLPTLSPDAPVTLANWRLAHTTLGNLDLQQAPIPQEGGLHLEMALKQLLLDYTHEPTGHYPLVILVQGKEESPVWEHSLRPLLDLSPVPMIVMKRQEDIWQQLATEAWPLSWKDVIGFSAQPLPATKTTTGLSLTSASLSAYEDLKPGTHDAAVAAYQYWLHYQSGNREPSISYADVVRTSMRAGVLTPATAFLSLESESQKNALLAKQEQILNGKAGLDPGENTRNMSEPPFWVVLLLAFGLLLLLKHKHWVQKLISNKDSG